MKTYCHVHLNGEVEKNTIKNTYISTPSDAIETCLFDPETDITFRPQYYAKDRTGWFFYRNEANLSGLSDGDTSYLSDFSGDIAVSIWTDKTAEKVLQLQYDLSQLKPENGTDIVTVTLLDEIVPFEIPY